MRFTKEPILPCQSLAKHSVSAPGEHLAMVLISQFWVRPHICVVRDSVNKSCTSTLVDVLVRRRNPPAGAIPRGHAPQSQAPELRARVGRARAVAPCPAPSPRVPQRCDLPAAAPQLAAEGGVGPLQVPGDERHQPGGGGGETATRVTAGRGQGLPTPSRRAPNSLLLPADPPQLALGDLPREARDSLQKLATDILPKAVYNATLPHTEQHSRVLLSRRRSVPAHVDTGLFNLVVGTPADLAGLSFADGTVLRATPSAYALWAVVIPGHTWHLLDPQMRAVEHSGARSGATRQALGWAALPCPAKRTHRAGHYQNRCTAASAPRSAAVDDEGQDRATLVVQWRASPDLVIGHATLAEHLAEFESVRRSALQRVQVYIKRLDGETLTLMVRPHWNVEVLKVQAWWRLSAAHPGAAVLWFAESASSMHRTSTPGS